MTTPFPFVAGAVLQAQQLNDITNLPLNDQTASYVLVVGDAGKRVIMNVASANTVTVNNSIFTAGDTVEVLNKGAGATTITAGAGVTINSASGLVVTQYQSGRLIALSASSFLFLETDITATSGVVQVKQATKLDTFSTSSTTFVDVTGLSVSITPTSASNKVLFIATIGGMGNTGSYVNILQLLRGSTNILSPTGGTDPGAVQLYQGSAGTGDNWCLAQGLTVLDSPATTSATTYKVQARVNNGTLHINRLPSNSNFTAVSTLTVMEVTP
jgi:hypothetical protein